MTNKDNEYGLFKSSDGHLYRILLSILTTGDEKEYPAYRFAKEEGEVKLRRYLKEISLTENRPDGIKRLKPITIGSPLDELAYSDYMSRPGARIEKYTGDPDAFDLSAASFNDLFAGLEEGREAYIDPSGTY